jgi:hypothetical protein
MTRTSLLLLSLSITAAACLGACGDDGGPNITLSDSGPADSGTPDATPPPDAFVCTLTECGSACVDTTTDSLHCGGCDLACDSPGQICSGSLPCACPESFVPTSIGGVGDQVFAQAGALVAIAPLGFSPLNAAIVVYDLTLLVDTDYDLAVQLAAVAPPSIAIGYDVDISSYTAKTAYAATEGILRFDRICDGGASGTVTNVVFEEIEGIMNLVPVEGGCSESHEALSFDIGTCPDI